MRQMVRMAKSGECCVMDPDAGVRSDWLHYSEQDAPLSQYELDYDLDFDDDEAVVVLRSDVTDEQIEALSTEAGTAGDLEQVAICRRALAGDEGARVECERVIRDARAQQD